MTPKSTQKDFPKNGAQLFYGLARDRLNQQLEHVDSVDNKIGLLVSLASGLMGILAAVFALRGTLGGAEIATLAVSALAYIVVSVLGIRAYFSRKWMLGPDLRQVWDALDKSDDEELVTWQVANTYWSFYEANRPAQRDKEQVLPFILIAVVIQSLVLVLALVLVAEGV